MKRNHSKNILIVNEVSKMAFGKKNNTGIIIFDGSKGPCVDGSKPGMESY